MTTLENDSRGLLVINADDWGRDRTTTDKILECTNVGTVSSVSAMVFMEDSERAAALSRDQRAEGVAMQERRPQLLTALNRLYDARDRQIRDHA